MFNIRPLRKSRQGSVRNQIPCSLYCLLSQDFNPSLFHLLCFLVPNTMKAWTASWQHICFSYVTFDQTSASFGGTVTLESSPQTGWIVQSEALEDYSVTKISSNRPLLSHVFRNQSPLDGCLVCGQLIEHEIKPSKCSPLWTFAKKAPAH